ASRLVLLGAAQRGAEAVAHRLLLGLLRRRFVSLLGGRGVRIVLAAEQLDLRDVRVVATADAKAEDARVTARPLDVPWRDRLEQLLHDLAVGDVARDGPARGHAVRAAFRRVQAALGNRDDPLHEGPQLFRARHGRLEPLVLDERRGLVTEHRDAMLRDPAQLSIRNSVTHDRFPWSLVLGYRAIELLGYWLSASTLARPISQ